MTKEKALKLVVARHAERERGRRELNRRLVAALTQAREAGCSLQEIGDALGVSHTMVRKMLTQWADRD